MYNNTTGVERGDELLSLCFEVTSQPYVIQHNYNITVMDRGDEGGDQCFTNTSCYLCVSGDITAIYRVP